MEEGLLIARLAVGGRAGSNPHQLDEASSVGCTPVAPWGSHWLDKMYRQKGSPWSWAWKTLPDHPPHRVSAWQESL